MTCCFVGWYLSVVFCCFMFCWFQSVLASFWHDRCRWLPPAVDDTHMYRCVHTYVYVPICICSQPSKNADARKNTLMVMQSSILILFLNISSLSHSWPSWASVVIMLILWYACPHVLSSLCINSQWSAQVVALKTIIIRRAIIMNMYVTFAVHRRQLFVDGRCMYVCMCKCPYP